MRDWDSPGRVINVRLDSCLAGRSAEIGRSVRRDFDMNGDCCYMDRMGEC